MATQMNDRIDLRISTEQKELFRRASVISGFKNLTEFIVHCVSKESKSLLMSERQLLKNEEDKRIFFQALQNPPSPNARLKQARLNYLKVQSEQENEGLQVKEDSQKEGV
jgi:uncharacterized protein (DUF1778 family)